MVVEPFDVDVPAVREVVSVQVGDNADNPGGAVFVLQLFPLFRRSSDREHSGWGVRSQVILIFFNVFLFVV